MHGKHILVGISGGIAAYKTATLVRLLVKAGAEVRVVMTPMAKQFITPLTLATLSKNPLLVDFFDPENGAWNSHVDLGLWADAFVIAPATANTLGKMCYGIADNLLITSYLSARCPVFVAPAMDLDMYQHPSTQHNLHLLAQRGVHLIEAEEGELASGLHGKGRMAEPETIAQHLHRYFATQGRLHGLDILLTAGPTYEPIDPVRFIGNHSSGKMGYALAEALAQQGARVHLISGPVALSAQHPNIQRLSVDTAQQMYQACTERFGTCQVAIMAAAVADYTPTQPEQQKLKRTADNYQIELRPTHDIAAALGRQKSENQLLVGFALETNNAQANALDKMRRKNLDLIVLNSLEHPGAGFRHDTNRVSLLFANGHQIDYPLKSKTEVAYDIVEQIYQLYAQSHPTQP